MKREDYLKWCQNCKKQSFDLQKGVICSLNNEIANFNTECEYFDFDKNLFKKNIVNEVRKLCNNPNDYILKPKLINWKKFNSKTSIPIELIIKNSNMLLVVLGLLLLDFFVIGLINYDEIKDFSISQQELKSIFKTFAFVLGGSFLGMAFIVGKILDKDPKITLTDKGLKIEKGKLFLWENTEFNVFVKQEDNSTRSNLIISRLHESDILFELNGLEYSPEKILHLIELYRNSETQS